jgi:hypothetical protein
MLGTAAKAPFTKTEETRIRTSAANYPSPVQKLPSEA